MVYPQVQPGRFLERPNRFIAMVETEGQVLRCHVKNTGRCRELLTPGAEVFLARGDAPGRKTPFDLVCVRKGDRLINMDSQAPNKVAAEYLPTLFPGLEELRGEQTFEDSRLDFSFLLDGRPGFAEVKGVTLEEGNLALFPDAPTLRGCKHLSGLIRAAGQGYFAALLFIVQLEGTKGVSPNDRTDPEFGRLLRQAAEAGVVIRAVECRVAPDRLECIGEVPVIL
ncbi:MAG: DNA/RNA nuclease SfsA [Ruminococcaceae bacterium]|nr:DNA/RNA nuclease SfsA [Oscillospiraceae bacterium]